MKAIIKSVTFKKEYESKYGTLFGFIVRYDDKSAYYSSKSKDQKKFVEGQEAEFTEETRTGNNGDYLVIKPATNFQQSNYGKAVKREQSKYSGFAMSYAKDLVVNQIVPHDRMFLEAELMLDWMVAKDKEIGS